MLIETCNTCNKSIENHPSTGRPLYYRVLNTIFYVYFCGADCQITWHQKQGKN